MFWLGLALGAVVASIPWWIRVRGLSGVISDLNDAKNTAQSAANKASSLVKK